MNLIKDFRSKPRNNLENRKKKRSISEKNVSGSFYKPLSNLLYGYLFTNNEKSDLRRFNKNAFIEYKKPKFKIINIEIFKKYYAVLSDIKKYLENTYSELYKSISKDYEFVIKMNI